ncbi:MAG: DUF2278 family protein [Gammaproteobacteria bacterium]
MSLQRYGVLKGRAIDRRLGQGESPHYQVHIVDEGTDYRIAVNVKSQQSPSELEYLVDDAFQHPVTAGLVDLPLGFTPLERKPNGLALDFIRGNLFDRSRMRPLPFNVPGPDNDLNEVIDHYIQRVMADESALVYAFGERWGPEDIKDKIFGFKPGNGIHDIHMNQANSAQFREDDGVWQDGAMLIHFPAQNQWVAVFLKFQSQGWHSDDITGHRIEPTPTPGPTPQPFEPQGIVRIVAALVNPIGPAPEKETVTLLNTSPQPIDLAGWTIANKAKQKHPLSGILPPGEAKVVTLPQTVQLGNQGGIITLLNHEGLKVDGVAYTKEQAQREGWTIVF